ncbi:UNVERIFIED_CONTAM: hypothetical protein RMT77_017039 [Armadillidium vulgare]
MPPVTPNTLETIEISEPSETDVYICCLSPEIQNLAKVELNEDPEIRDEYVLHIREWILEQPHLNARTDTQFILRYLRGCKFSLERTKEKIDKYYTSKASLPELFKNRDPFDECLREIFDLQLMVPLPGYDCHGRKVILSRLGAWTPYKHRPEDLFRAASMLFDVLFIEDEQMSVTGFVQVNDMTGISFRHASCLSLSLVRKVMTVWTEGYPIRPKAVHYINTTPAFNTVFNLFNRFTKEKMRKRIMVHGKKSYEDLFQYVPRKMLPQEYGGTAASLRDLTDEWIEKLTNYKDWFLEDENYLADESKRRSSFQRNFDFFWFLGSFRKSVKE